MWTMATRQDEEEARHVKEEEDEKVEKPCQLPMASCKWPVANGKLPGCQDDELVMTRQGKTL